MVSQAAKTKVQKIIDENPVGELLSSLTSSVLRHCSRVWSIPLPYGITSCHCYAFVRESAMSTTELLSLVVLSQRDGDTIAIS
jgi:hypothetical protein